ncbi:MAG: hypothetical protein A4E65_03762 [Syntrophorhabdus sp. PtaU1.Bin153]|nr:MAG: hypothetical protein A4E65_03762 [Syntrophorhabdus sp. PtaU1.Bin153]
MKKLMVLTVVLFMVMGIACTKGHELNKRAGDYSVAIRIDKNPPVAGKNSIQILITDQSGKVVTNAKVVLAYSMPAMPGMPAASYTADATLAGNIYTATVDYSMAGPWDNEVKITRGDKTVSTKFTVDAK